MKMLLPNDRSRASLMKTRLRQWVISFIIASFFSSACASCFVRHEFGLLTAMMLATSAILAGSALFVLLKRNNIGGAHRTQVNKDASRVTSKWDYRPGIRRWRPASSGGASAGICLVVTPEAPPVNAHDVWRNLWAQEHVAANNNRQRAQHSYIDGNRILTL